MKRTYSILVAWYGLWQAVHGVMNAAQLLGWRSPLVTGEATGQALEVLWVSGDADLFVASSLGVAFAVGHRLDRGWAEIAGVISLTVAFYSAGAWTYLHAVMGTWHPTAGRVALMWGPFVPHLILGPWVAARLGRREPGGSD